MPVVCWAERARLTAWLPGRTPELLIRMILLHTYPLELDLFRCGSKFMASGSKVPCYNSFLSHNRRLATVKPTNFLSEDFSNQKNITLNVPKNRFG